MENNQPKINTKLIVTLGFIATIPFYILSTASILIIVYQIVIFAITGNWESMSMADISTFDWIKTKLLGVYKIMTWLPASLTLFTLSWLFLFLGIYVVDTMTKK